MRPAPVRHVSLAVGILAAVSLFAGGFGCSKEPAAPQPVVKRAAPKPEAKAPAAPAPVPVGSRIRAHTTVNRVEKIGEAVQFSYLITVEIDGSDKPALVSEQVLRVYP